MSVLALNTKLAIHIDKDMGPFNGDEIKRSSLYRMKTLILF